MAAVFSLAVLVAACGGDDLGDAKQGATTTPPSAATPSPTVQATPAGISLIAGGDVMLGRSLGDGIVSSGSTYPFEFVASLLVAADIAFVNLEAPLTEGGEPANKDFVFRGPLAGAKSLADAGVDIVSLANNHVFDYGPGGLQDTFDALGAAGVAYAGAGPNVTAARAPRVVERGGVRVAFLGYVNTLSDSVSGFDVSSTQATDQQAGVAWLSPEAVAADVAAAKLVADVVVVSMHTGNEYQEPPSALQVASAHAAIDAGAALVLGSHPHVLQGLETYNGGLIIYSLGNFVFDFDFVDYSISGLPSALSAMLRVNLSESGVVKCEVVPVVIGEADGRPRPVTGTEAALVLDRLRRLSDGSCGLK